MGSFPSPWRGDGGSTLLDQKGQNIFHDNKGKKMGNAKQDALQLEDIFNMLDMDAMEIAIYTFLN